jgi:cobalt-zinc-cadmium efflux system outer membrane protein
MRWHRGLWLLLLGACATHAAEPADDEQPLSLDAAVEQALHLAPQLAARTANVDAAQALAEGAGRLPDPELIVGIDNLPVTGADAWSTTRDFMTMRKVGVMQEFPAGAKRRLQRERADAQTILAGAELVQMRLTVAREVAQAWIRRASAETSLEQLRTLQPEVEWQAAAARAALGAGRGSTAEALAAESTVAQLANRVLRLESETRRAQLDLARWIDTHASRPLASMPSLDRLPTPADDLVAKVHEHAPLRPYEFRAELARLDVELARAERRPDWSSELAFSKRGSEFSDMVSLEFRIGLPLFVRHRQNPVIAARNAELRQLEADRAVELRMHTAELQQVLVDWESLGKELGQYDRELVPLAHERSRAALAAYRAGRAELSRALEAYQQEIDIVLERAALQNERGRAWAYLRYLEPQHLHP